MSDSRPIRIAQLSDTHFLAADGEAEGGFAYNTDEAFQVVADSLATAEPFDLVVLTGDVADHGTRDEYVQAARALSQLQGPTNVCPGNHDQGAVFTSSMGRPGIATSRAIELDDWCFLFVDSNAGVLIPDESGRHVDPPDYGDRLHSNGALGSREAAWIRDMCTTTQAAHVFIWVHHPPAAPVGLTADRAYDAEWVELLAGLTNVRGIGGGHTHVPDEYSFQGHPVFVCPSLKNNFDLHAETLLPPGYRTYEFHPDGTVSGEAVLCDDERWPRHPVGRAVMALMRGDLSWQEFDAIVARKRAATASSQS